MGRFSCIYYCDYIYKLKIMLKNDGNYDILNENDILANLGKSKDAKLKGLR